MGVAVAGDAAGDAAVTCAVEGCRTPGALRDVSVRDAWRCSCPTGPHLVVELLLIRRAVLCDAHAADPATAAGPDWGALCLALHEQGEAVPRLHQVVALRADDQPPCDRHVAAGAAP